MTVLTPDVLAAIAEAVRQAPPLSTEQVRRLRAIWAPAAQKCKARRVEPAGELITKGS